MEQILEKIDRSTTAGKRDYAILALMNRRAKKYKYTGLILTI